MKLARESRYAVAALASLARLPEGTRLGSREIAATIKAPAPFLAKVLAKLMHEGVLTSVRGGGYALARPAREISVGDVLTAMEGPDLFARCIFWRDECSEAAPCPLHPTWAGIRPQVETALSNLSILDVAPDSSMPAPRMRSEL